MRTIFIIFTIIIIILNCTVRQRWRRRQLQSMTTPPTMATPTMTVLLFIVRCVQLIIIIINRTHNIIIIIHRTVCTIIIIIKLR